MILAAAELPLTRFGVGLGCVAIGVLLIREALRSLADSVDRTRGPTTPGHIVSSRLQGPSGPDLDTWHLHVTYEYEVNGRRYTGTRIAPTHQSFTGWWSAMRQARKYRSGTHVRVQFDPAAPDRAILDPRLAASPAWIFLLGGAGLAIGGVLELTGVTRFVGA